MYVCVFDMFMYRSSFDEGVCLFGNSCIGVKKYNEGICGSVFGEERKYGTRK